MPTQKESRREDGSQGENNADPSRECLQPPEAGRGKGGSSPRAFGGTPALLTSSFSPLKRILTTSLQNCVLCDCSCFVVTDSVMAATEMGQDEGGETNVGLLQDTITQLTPKSIRSAHIQVCYVYPVPRGIKKKKKKKKCLFV